MILKSEDQRVSVCWSINRVDGKQSRMQIWVVMGLLKEKNGLFKEKRKLNLLCSVKSDSSDGLTLWDIYVDGYLWKFFPESVFQLFTVWTYKYCLVLREYLFLSLWYFEHLQIINFYFLMDQSCSYKKHSFKHFFI